ncbi:hypothetical protein [Microbacterium sp. 1P10AE]|jgi:hypothetical protein|uniref:hypothetical protein n=1 Tax=Microbacterium sp. 1P10AE TaxID=3132286 RepID=UPI00399FB077
MGRLGLGLVAGAAVVVLAACSAPAPTPTPSPRETEYSAQPAILVGLAPPRSASLVEDLAGTLAVNDQGCVVLQALLPVESELVVIWPIGTSAGPGRVDLVDGSFDIGDSIDPARGWLTTLGDLAPGAFLEGRDGPCGHTEAAPAVVITQIVGGPTQE